MVKPLPKLPHMPLHIKKLIVESADTVTKNVLRLCSKKFNDLAEKSGNFYKLLDVEFNALRNSVIITFSNGDNDSIELEYRHRDNGYPLIDLRNQSQKHVRNGNFFEAIVIQFSKMFRSPKSCVKRFALRFQPFFDTTTVLQRLETFLTSSEYPIAVKEFCFVFNSPTEHDILKVLPHLKPGTLERIHLKSVRPDGHRDYRDVKMDNVTQTEQWRQAKECFLNEFYTKLLCEQWTHFSKMKYAVREFTVDFARLVLEALDNSIQWNQSTIHFEWADYEELINYFSRLGGRVRRFTREYIFYLSTPNLKFSLKVSLMKGVFHVEKLRRKSNAFSNPFLFFRDKK